MMRIIIHQAAMKRFLTSPRSPVGRIIDEKANDIYIQAKNNIQTTFTRRSGALEDSLRQIPIEDATGYHVVVGTDAKSSHGTVWPDFPYARGLETGMTPGGGVVPKKPFMVPAVEQAGFRPRGT